MTLFVHDLLAYPFLQSALIAGILISVACGIIGTFVVVKRSTYTAGAVSHCVLAGIGGAVFLEKSFGVEWANPILGALIAAVLAALTISWLTIYRKQRSDAVLSAVWALGMAIGISFMAATPGYGQDLMSYLFGNILMISTRDLIFIGGLLLFIALFLFGFYNKIVAICFNEEMAKLRGLNVGALTAAFNTITALCIVMIIQAVGIVLAIALLTIPAATAAQLTRRLPSMILLSVLISLFCVVAGMALSYLPDLPVGATIVELAGLIYLIVILGKSLSQKRFVTRP